MRLCLRWFNEYTSTTRYPVVLPLIGQCFCFVPAQDRDVAQTNHSLARRVCILNATRRSLLNFHVVPVRHSAFASCRDSRRPLSFLVFLIGWLLWSRESIASDCCDLSLGLCAATMKIQARRASEWIGRATAYACHRIKTFRQESRADEPLTRASGLYWFDTTSEFINAASPLTNLTHQRGGVFVAATGDNSVANFVGLLAC